MNAATKYAVALASMTALAGCSLSGLDDLNKLGATTWVQVDEIGGNSLDRAVLLESVGDRRVVAVNFREIETTTFEFRTNGTANASELEEATFKPGPVTESFSGGDGVNAAIVAVVDGTTRVGAIRPGVIDVTAVVIGGISEPTGVAVSGQRLIVGSPAGPTVIGFDGSDLGSCELTGLGAVSADPIYLFGIVGTQVTILTVDGITSGACASPASILIPPDPATELGALLETADTDGDTLADLIVASSSDGDVIVWSGGGAAVAVDLPSAAVPTDIALGDFDADGAYEIAVSDADSGIVYLFETDGSEFAEAPSLHDVDSATGYGKSIAAFVFEDRHILSVGTNESLFTYFRISGQQTDPRR